MNERMNRLIDYCQGIYKGEDGKKLYIQYKEDIESVTPEEVIQIEYEQLRLGMTPKEMLTFVDKIMHVFHKPLSNYALLQDKPDFIEIMTKENHELEKRLHDFKGHMKTLKLLKKSELNTFIKDLQLYDIHLQKLENLVFSNLEQKQDYFEGLKIMWSLHDDIRKLMKEIISTDKRPDELAQPLGRLYFMLFGSVMKQNLILLPLAIKNIEKKAFDKMYLDAFEYGFSYIEKPNIVEEHVQFDHPIVNFMSSQQELETLISILDHLNVDFTFIDDQDQVKLFNAPEDRIFPRSMSIIGRNVRNCHPPESVHIVEEILEAFKSKKKSHAKFWINMGQETIMIQYKPIFINGVYKGTLEVSQKISEIMNLKGERRLLDWS